MANMDGEATACPSRTSASLVRLRPYLNPLAAQQHGQQMHRRMQKRQLRIDRQTSTIAMMRAIFT